jgi:hypothetical protein
MREDRLGGIEVTAGQEQMAIALLRHAAIGERMMEVAYASFLEARTAREFWGVVRMLSTALGLPGLCLMLDGRLFEVGQRGGGEKVMAIGVPRGRMVVRMEKDSMRATLALIWLVRQTLEEGAGRER